MKVAGQRGSPAVVVAAVAAVVLALVHASQAVTIMSIDFGSEWMKVAVVAPGVPMEIALNKESKRKTPVAISFRNGERMFGEDALTNGIRAPPSTYFYLLDLLGKKVEGNPVVEVFKRRFPYYNVEADPERGTVVFRHDRNTTFTVEELVGQLLGHARDLATAHTDQRIKDCVITVPPFFNQAERRALLSAAQLTGLKVLSLMSSNAAVALNHGMFRRKEVNGTAQNILFYDMGAASTTATIVAYQTTKTKERGYSETNPQVTVLGVGYDRLLGGLDMQLRLRDHLARKFEEVKKTPNSVYESPRAMAKLLKEAGRVAKVLSANSETVSQVEGVLDEEDFRLPIKREEFEEMCADIFDRVRAPVDSALVSAGMDISAIDQFIIVGGATRIPRIQAILQEVWGRELGKNINADEAAAMGAVYRAADLGQGFKVKKFHVKEAVLFPVEVDFERKVEASDPSSSGGAASTTKVVKRSLFALGNNYPQKKVMTFNKHTSDFTFAVNYGVNEHLSRQELRMAGLSNLSAIEVSGVTSAFKKHQGEGAEPKGIKVHFHMDDSGVLGLVGVEAVFEKSVEVEVEAEAAAGDKGAEQESTLSRLSSTISKLFSGAEEEEREAAGEGRENQTKEEEEEEKKKKKKKEEEEGEEKKEGEKKEEEGKKEEKKVKRSQVTIKEELNFTVTFLDLPDMTPKALKASQKKLEDISAAEVVRHEREAARNTLESYILDAQDKLWQREYEEASTDQQRESVRELCAQLDEWIYEEGAEQEAEVYRAKLGQLSEVFEPIKRRVQEHHDRPDAVQALLDMVNGSSVFLQKAREVPQDDQLFTEVEMASLNDLIQKTKEWLKEKVKLQDSRPAHEDPVMTLSDVAEKWNAMDREIKYLINKAKIVKAKKDREAVEAKLKAERAAKEEEKAGRRKNATTEQQQQQQEGKEKEQEARKEEEEEVVVVDAAGAEKKAEGEEEEEGGDRKQEQEEDPLNIFQETGEENNSEGDRRKGGGQEEEEAEVEDDNDEEEIKEEEEDEEKGPAGGGGGGADGGSGGNGQKHSEL